MDEEGSADVEGAEVDKCDRTDDGSKPKGYMDKNEGPSTLLHTEERGSTLREVPAAIPRGKRDSVTSELFHLWLSSPSVGGDERRASNSSSPPTPRCRRQLDHLDEGELFMELVRDVATELDLDVLCHKILVNVCILTCADRGSLFLARGPRGARSLAAKLFDVRVDTPLEDALRRARQQCPYRIPFGVGIAGLVAQTNEGVNIKNAYEDSRFNPEMDERTGYETRTILCMPICNREDEVIGVAEIINKTEGRQEFTERDVEVFRRYLAFCGIGIQNAQLFEMSVLEYRRNQDAAWGYQQTNVTLGLS